MYKYFEARVKSLADILAGKRINVKYVESEHRITVNKG